MKEQKENSDDYQLMWIVWRKTEFQQTKKIQKINRHAVFVMLYAYTELNYFTHFE